MSATDAKLRFEQLVTPHLDAAYNLAHWLAGNDHDAQDIVQEACVRAFRFADGFRGLDSRPWVLKIVRNTAYTWLKKNRSSTTVPLGDEAMAELEDESAATTFDQFDSAQLRAALEALPPEFREAIVLREIEGLSYKEIADVAAVPVGTVMSRLARARAGLQQHFKRKGAL